MAVVLNLESIVIRINFLLFTIRFYPDRIFDKFEDLLYVSTSFYENLFDRSS